MTSEPDPSASREAHPSHLALELWAFTPEGQPRDASVGEHLARCPSCTGAVGRWRQERAAFLARRPAPAFLDTATAGASATLPGRRPPSRWRAAGLALAASLVAAVGWRLANPAGEGVVHLKGAAGLTLELLASRDGAPASPAPPGVVLEPGDVLRFAISVPQDGYVSIVDVDATGRFTRYFPQVGAGGAPAGRATRLVLPGSIALDDYLGEERIVLVFSTAPLDDARLEQALRAAYQRAGLDGLEHAELPALLTSVSVHKGAR